MSIDLERHPCFNDKARHQYGRIHLPVAPKCNIQCSFCNRKYDCANESRPGVTSQVLAPHQALDYLDRVMAEDPRIAVVGIAGPGDPFANPEETMATLRLVRAKYPEMLLCVASNGLNLPPYVDELAELEVSHVTVTITAVDPEVSKDIYMWVRDHKRVYRGRPAAELLLERQLESIRRLKAKGITVKINTIVIPGVNDHHVIDVARQVKDLGADILNCVPLCPVADTPFEEITPPSNTAMAALRAQASTYLPQMQHCTRCRADACGLLGESLKTFHLESMKSAANAPLNPREHRPYVAVATMEGMLVNEHLGHARELMIFARNDDGTFECVDTRTAPEPGDGNARWLALGRLLSDCRALLASSAGSQPQRVLQHKGVKVHIMEGLIEEGLLAVYEGQPIRSPVRQTGCRKEAGCTGNGTGCG